MNISYKWLKEYVDFDLTPQQTADALTGSAKEKLQSYFSARLRFFAEHPQFLGIFADAAFNPPPHLTRAITALRQPFDELTISVLTGLLESAPLRKGLSVSLIVEDFRMYMDFFNMRFCETVYMFEHITDFI